MAKNLLRRGICVLLALIMCVSVLSVGAFAAESSEKPFPEVTVSLTPGEASAKTEEAENEEGKLTREVNATTSEITTTTKQTVGQLNAIQPDLKFDRNSTADQKAQKVARELYTDNGHFHDPSTFTVTDAPEGYPFKYVGHGDYSGHYVSHVRVVYARDDAGNAIKDAAGNYVIDHLEHVSSGTPLYYGGELTTNVDGPFHYATGTRSQQFLLKDEAQNTYYGYCIDLATGAESATWYALANLEDNHYYASKEAEDHVRGIVFNGYWGTNEGTGSLASLKEALKAAVAGGSVEKEYDIQLVNRKKFTTGYELQEGEYHYGSYVYWDLPAEHVTLTADVIDQMTEGEALDAMQAAIWSYANGSQATLNGVDGVVVGDLSAASSQMSDSLNGNNDPAGAARTRALYSWLMQQTATADTVIVNDKTFVEDMSLTIGKKISDKAFEAKLNFSNSFTVNQDKDNLKVVLTYVDADGVTQTIEKALTGEDALVADDNGYYTIDGLKLSAENPFQFTLNIVGEQYLTKNAYIFTSEKGVSGSQTMVSMAEGSIQVDVSKSVEIAFDVKETFDPKPTPPTITFKPGQASNISFMLIDEETGAVEFLYKIDIENQTSFEIPTEEGKISAVFVKQSTSGMFWFAEEVDEATQQAVIDCLKANNPSYKGHNAIAFGAGDHELEFKKNKFATYTFGNASAELKDEEVPAAAAPEETEAVVEETVAPEEETPAAPVESVPAEPASTFHEGGKTHLLGDAENDLATFNFKVVDEYIPEAGEERYAVVGSGEQTEFWTAYLNKGGDLKVTDKDGNTTDYSYVSNAKKINGIYLDGVFYPAESDAISYPGKEEGSSLVANYNGLQQAMLMNGNDKKVAVYCVDHVISTTTEALYNVVNIEDATHYDEQTASKLRAIAVNGYWGGTETVDQYGSLAKMKAMMAASGEFTQEEIDHLSPGVALSATQFALWELANDDDERQVVNVQYIQKNRVAGYNGKTWNTLKVTPAAEDACVDLIFKLSHYLTQLPGIPASEMSTANTVLSYKNILKDVAIEVVKKAEGHANNADDNKDNDAFVTNVTFDMLQVSQKDSLVAKIVDAEGNVYATGRIAGAQCDGEIVLTDNGNGTYTFPNVTLIENAETTYTVVVEGVQYLERNVYLYFAGERETSQTLIGYDEGHFQVDVESSVKKTFNVEDPETPPTITFKPGQASNISFMLIDAAGNVSFLNKIDIGNQTSFEIPTEEGKISAVFVKQSTSGMFWFAQEVDEDIQQAVIDCLKANNPSYKGHNAIAFGEGEHDLEFKKGKIATYVFDGDFAWVEIEAPAEAVVEEPVVEEPVVEEPVVEEPVVEEPIVEEEVVEEPVEEPAEEEVEETEPEVEESNKKAKKEKKNKNK